MIEHISGYLINPDPNLIADFNYIYQTTLKLVRLLNMQILDQPKIVREEEPLKGNSVVCIIKTSHIAFHFMETNKQKSRFTIDSCKPFNKERLITFLETAYHCTTEIKAEY